MNCPKCGNVVAAKRSHCDRCGEDLTVYRKMYLLSNRYYNEGLEKAKVRDLSGAVLVLKKSLEINKRNTNARNLLGLIYYETGETVSALSEWVISKHFQPDENDADDYINALQSNPTKLESLNQTIKKYNNALAYAQQGSDDLAIIQLKKVVSLNPHFIKALQLLALLHMKNGENEKAVKYLISASKIDVSNTTTLRYLHELGEMNAASRDDSYHRKESPKKDGKVYSQETTTVFPTTSYKEDKPNVWVFINLILGIAIGVLGVFFLIVPTVEEKYKNQLKNQEVEYVSEINKTTQNMASVEKKNDELEKQVKELQAQLESAGVTEEDDTIYDKLFNAAKIYIEEISKTNRNDVDYVKIANALSEVNGEQLEKEGAKNLYNQIKDASYENASNELYDTGHDYYSNGKYEEALDTLLKAYEYNSQNVDAIYFIGRSYHRLNDYDNARKYYEIILDKFPDSKRASEAQEKLSSLG
ncbi:MAG: TolA-binding protein [Lachnoclostridium sp.]|jgi:tetratricopeptide (TPR) repeat protein